MTLCGWCEKRIWPWQHYGFRVMATGEARWHVACGQIVDRIQRENQQQAVSYEMFLARLEDEDGGW